MSASPFAGRRLHLIGVGGAGMSGLALVARALGAEVTGSDRVESSYVERLRAAGIEPRIGHSAEAVPSGAEVVVSTAIADDNPELAAARAVGARVLHRSDLLAEIAAFGRTIAVTGTHGKTTTASMAAHVLLETGRDPAYLIGGELRSTGANAAWGDGGWIVVEADESDRSFLKLAPDVGVVTNVELDHHTTYATLAELELAMVEFATRADALVVEVGAARRLVGGEAGPGRDAVPLGSGRGGRGSAPGSSEAERRRTPTTGRRTLTYGIEGGDLAAEALELVFGGSRFTVAGVSVELGVPGEHNVLNALAALAACREAGVPVAEAAPALATFVGAGRRFEPRGATATGAQVYDDYAHHPTEIRATLAAARTLDPGRLVVCFQPHLFSRTRHLARELGAALGAGDVIIVLDVYPARERAEDFPGVSGFLVAEAAADAARGRPVYWAPSLGDAEEVLRRELRAGDVLVTLGAGDIDRLADAFGGARRSQAEPSTAAGGFSRPGERPPVGSPTEDGRRHAAAPV